MTKINIAIDGYSGTGKSSTAKAVAAELGYTYLDSGAMYRAVTFHFLQNNIDLKNVEHVKRELQSIKIEFRWNAINQTFEICLNGQNVESEIRGMTVSQRVSEVSAIPEVREILVDIQRELGRAKGVVMDGRDIGTVVFPNAELKVFVIADVGVRAERRKKELEEKGNKVSLEEIITNLEERDKVDTTRATSPLKKAADAVVLDTTDLHFEQQVEKVVQLAKEITSAA